MPITNLKGQEKRMIVLKIIIIIVLFAISKQLKDKVYHEWEKKEEKNLILLVIYSIAYMIFLVGGISSILTL